MKTVIIEKLPFLGGNMTGGLPWMGFHAPVTMNQVVGGIPYELVMELKKTGYATDFIPDPIAGSSIGVNGLALKILLARMAIEAKIDVILHSTAVDCRKSGDKITGVVMQNKQGGQLVEARVFIDATDSADLCQFAGAKTRMGRNGDEKRQVSSYAVVFGGIDFPEMFDYFEKNPGQIRPFPLTSEEEKVLLTQMRGAPLCIFGAFEKIIARARANGLNYPRKQLIGVGYLRLGELLVVASRVNDVNPNDVINHSKSELEGLIQTTEIEKLLRNYLPGCSRARLVSSGAQLGMREVRHVEGDYILTGADLLTPKEFPDTVCRGAYHLDIHTPDNDGLAARRQPPVYGIPYRSLLVKGIEGLLVAGRGISADHDALSSTRVAPISAAQGEAAGLAAAIAVKRGITPREINVTELQKVLTEKNCII
jgi:hypothetical protein